MKYLVLSGCCLLGSTILRKLKKRGSELILFVTCIALVVMKFGMVKIARKLQI